MVEFVRKRNLKAVCARPKPGVNVIFVQICRIWDAGGRMMTISCVVMAKVLAAIDSVSEDGPARRYVG
jgi:hypothetical protein